MRRLVEAFWLDFKHGARLLTKQRTFSLIAVISIAIGVGVNAAMFSVADTLVLRPLDVPRASELYTATAVVPRSGFATPVSAALSYPDYVELRDRTQSFSSIAAYRLVVAGFSAAPGRTARRTFGMAVSGNLFETLGIQPTLGRATTPQDDRPGAGEAVVVLDHDAWQRDFAGDATVLGRLVRIGGVDMTIIGVTPPGFSGPDQFVRPRYYIPVAMLPRLAGPESDELERRDLRTFAVKGRLKADVTLASANEEARLLAADVERRYPDTNRNQSLAVRTELEARLDARPQLAVLATMLVTLSVAVLLVCCANVAGLLTSRAPVRTREMALRLALGAARPRIVRQLVAETLLLALAGGALGLALGYAVILMFRRMQFPTDVPLKLDYALDGRVLATATLIAVLSAIVSSLAPAWRTSRVALATTMKAAPERQRALLGLNALVFGQIAMSLVLLTAAVFLYRAYQVELDRGPGFRTERVLMMKFDPELVGFDGPRTDAFYRLLTERSRALPGVVSAGLTSSPPMDQISVESVAIAPEGFQLPQGTESVRIRSARVDEGYLDTLDIAVLSGRDIDVTDTASSLRVALVNRTLAERYWPNQSAVGKRVRLEDGAQSVWIEIAGVTADSKYRSLSEEPQPFIYFPRAQRSAPMSTLLVQTAGNPADLAASLAELVRSLEPNMPVFGVQTMEAFFEASTVNLSRMIIRVIGAMGATGVMLAMVGLYGLVAYSVSRRTREIGIRVAVGASPHGIVWAVLRKGVLLAAAGSAAGLIGSVAIGGLLRAAFPFPGIPRLDVPTYLIVVPLLFASTLIAAWLPARRAARVDPLVALRQE